MEGPPCDASNSRTKRPKRATTNPKPIIASPVRIQAKSVLSAARYTRGSFSGKSGSAKSGFGTSDISRRFVNKCLPWHCRHENPPRASLYDHLDRQCVVNYVATVSFIVFVGLCCS